MLTFPIPTSRVCVSSKGIVDTAIGGQRIEEFLVNDTTINSCSNSRVDAGVWNGQLWAKMVMPFVNTTITHHYDSSLTNVFRMTACR